MNTLYKGDKDKDNNNIKDAVVRVPVYMGKKGIAPTILNRDITERREGKFEWRPLYYSVN